MFDLLLYISFLSSLVSISRNPTTSKLVSIDFTHSSKSAEISTPLLKLFVSNGDLAKFFERIIP